MMRTLGGMSKKKEIASSAVRDEVEQDSVFDFLYHDGRRVASFLSQFDDNGLLTGLTQSEAVAIKAKRSKRIGFGGNSPLGGGNIDFELGPAEGGSEGMERVYDPFWANAREFLDVLETRKLLSREIAEATLGQFVLVSGYLNIKDLGMLKEAWKAPSIQKKIKQGMGSGKKLANMTAAQKAAAREEQENADLFLDMLQIMPHSVHASLITSDLEQPALVWCAINQDYLIMPPSDIALTYGQMMSGEWCIVGVLSARPEFQTPDLTGEIDQSSFGLTDSIIGQVSGALAPIVRFALGRPAAAYAITPLLIFREVR